MIFDVQRYSIHDGTGIRTNIFFKGCPLRCLWCSNPESQSSLPELMFDDRSCRGFRDCIRAGNGAIEIKDGRLRIRRGSIKDPDIYREICPSKALKIAGEDKTIEELITEIEKDLPFYDRSGGGITLTGGEPFEQDEYLNALLASLKGKGIKIAVETCLHVNWRKIERNISYIDEFLVDLKHLDNLKFREFTGGNVHLITENIKKLDEMGIRFIIRIPVIPNFNNTTVEMKNMIDFVVSLKNADEVHFIPYHSLGKEKYKLLGRTYSYNVNEKAGQEGLNSYIQYALKKGLKANIGG